MSKDLEIYKGEVTTYVNSCRVTLEAEDVDPIKAITIVAFTKNVMHRIIWDREQAKLVHEAVSHEVHEMNDQNSKEVKLLRYHLDVLQVAIEGIQFPFLMDALISEIYNKSLPF